MRGEMKDTLLEKRRLLQLLEDPFLDTSNRTYGNRSKMYQERVRLDIRKSFFTAKEVGYWNRLPKEILDAPCPSVLKRHLYNAFSACCNIWLALKQSDSWTRLWTPSKRDFLYLRNCEERDERGITMF